MWEALRRRIAADIEASGGRHDEPALYAGATGDPGLAGGPGSMSWEIHGDLASIAVAGSAAILMEVLHPSVMAGVETHSSYRTDPLRRARNTLGYVLRTTFGSTPAATRVIEGVRGVHARVQGRRDDGVAYRALDPELIAWVHTCIPWAVMSAYSATCRPLSVAEQNRYLAEQAVIGRMGGADRVPETVSELDDYVESMRPRMHMTDQTRSFFEFVSGRSADLPLARAARIDRWLEIRGSMSLMPEWARRLTGTWVPEPATRLLQRQNRLRARLVRWAHPELPCKRMALLRATGSTEPSYSYGATAGAERAGSPSSASSMALRL